jgi:tetratricopeptide (TPR) repeat protein
VGLSRCHYRQGKRDEALQDLRRAAEVQPDDGFVQLELGQAYEQHNRTREALDAYERAIRLLRLPDAYFRKAQLLAKSDPARARDAWKGFLEAIEAMGGPASESDRVRVEMAKRALQ